MGTGFLIVYKRFEDGRLSWPRTTQEAADLTEEQFHYLMMGLNPLEPKVKELEPKKYTDPFVQNREKNVSFSAQDSPVHGMSSMPAGGVLRPL